MGKGREGRGTWFRIRRGGMGCPGRLMSMGSVTNLYIHARVLYECGLHDRKLDWGAT